MSILLQISISNRAQALTYEQLHPEDWIKDKGAQKRYRELCFKVLDWPRDRDTSVINSSAADCRKGNGVVDQIQTMLMCLIMLFSSDFLELDDPRRVSSVQTKYGALLYRYLKTKYRRDDIGSRASKVALAKFCQGMFVSSMSREMREIKELHWKNN